jgi:hypothetical protein
VELVDLVDALAEHIGEHGLLGRSAGALELLDGLRRAFVVEDERSASWGAAGWVGQRWGRGTGVDRGRRSSRRRRRGGDPVRGRAGGEESGCGGWSRCGPRWRPRSTRSGAPALMEPASAPDWPSVIPTEHFHAWGSSRRVFEAGVDAQTLELGGSGLEATLGPTVHAHGSRSSSFRSTGANTKG